jgi:hypothetical protein
VYIRFWPTLCISKREADRAVSAQERMCACVAHAALAVSKKETDRAASAQEHMCAVLTHAALVGLARTVYIYRI